ncbi:TOG array regulator of axonemal microtubules protein 2-like [Grus japonensis]|uniref:TOG array regulator of axonemal microtubules protein 2-like n=1 Tax=Grus japonensis TaxID=30415 RepID=A0ABC9XYU4_GRUJA
MKATETGEEEMPDNSPSELEDAVIPFVWATEQPGKAKSTEPVKIELKPGAKPVYSSCADLKDVPLRDPDWELFTDGSSFVIKGEWKAGYAVITLEKEIEAQPLPVNTSAQKAKLTALT